MKLVLISDTHGQHTRLALPAGDTLIHAGDWSRAGKEIDTIIFLKWFQSQPHRNKIFIAGNHDWFPEKHPAEFKDLLAIHAPDCIYLEDSPVIVDGYSIYGSPGSPFFNNWAFNYYRGSQIRAHWDKIPDGTEILLTHGPVSGILDQVKMVGSPNRGQHVGCQDLKEAVDKRLTRLICHISGHIHEEYGMQEENGVKYFNCSVLNEHYQLANEPHVVDIPDKK